MKKITILITDDHTLLRETWSLVLGTHPQFEVVAECSSGEEAIEAAKKLRPDIVLMDINLPGITGIEATQQIRKYSPASKILCISQHTQMGYFKKIMRTSAMGYVTKNSSQREMFEAIQDVYKGKKYICEEIKSILSTSFLEDDETKINVSSLSERELQIIGYIRKGYISKEIATELSVSVKTVEVHRHNILRKLHIKNAAALVNLVHNELPD
jgi:DNA-binding NarL/FixJ family response regulator